MFGGRVGEGEGRTGALRPRSKKEIPGGDGIFHIINEVPLLKVILYQPTVIPT